MAQSSNRGQSTVNPGGKSGFTPPLEKPIQSIVRRVPGEAGGGFTPPLQSGPVTSTNPVIQQAEAPKIEVNPISNRAQGFTSSPIQYPTSFQNETLNQQAKNLNLTQQDVQTLYKIQGSGNMPNQKALEDYARAKDVIQKDFGSKVSKVLSGESKFERTATGEIITPKNVNEFVQSNQNNQSVIFRNADGTLFGVTPELEQPTIVSGPQSIPVERTGNRVTAEVKLTPKQVQYNESQKNKEVFKVARTGFDRTIGNIPSIASGIKSNFKDINTPQTDFNTQLLSGQRQSRVTDAQQNKFQLEGNLNQIRSQVEQGKISQQVAEQQRDEAIHDFTSKEIIRGIPANVALGLALGFSSLALGAVGLAPVAYGIDTYFLTNALRRQNSLLAKFKEFPKEASLELASTLVGGLVGARAGAGITGSAVKVNIDPVEAKSIKYISGDKLKEVRNTIKNADPQFKLLLERGKITNLEIATIEMKDGRTFNIASFNKETGDALSKPLVGEKQIVGYEVVPQLKEVRSGPFKLQTNEVTGFKIGERVIGSSIGRRVGESGENVIQLYRFKPAEARLTKALEKLNLKKGLGEEVTVLERSKLISTQGELGIGKVQTSTVQSESRVLEVKNLSKSLSNKVNEINRRLESGGKINNAEIRNLVNFERRLKGQKLFTEKEWKDAGQGVLTDTQISTYLKSADLTAQRISNLTGEVRSGLRVKTFSLGSGTSKVIPKVEPKIKRTSSFKGISKSEFKKNIDKINPTGEKGLRVSDSNFGKPQQNQLDKGASLAKLKERILQNAKPTRSSFGGIARGLGKVTRTGLRVEPIVRSTVKRSLSPQPSTGSFAGQGTYERTEEFNRLAPVKSQSIISQNETGGFKDLTRNNLKQSSPLRIQDRTDLKVDNAFKTEFKSQSSLGTGLQNRLREEQKPKSKFKLGLQEQQKFKQLSQSKLKLGERVSFKEKFKPKLRVTTTPTPSLDNSKPKRSGFKDLRKPGFDTLVKDKGKFVRINPRPFRTKEEALGFGFKVTKNILGRSVTTTPTLRANPLSSTSARAEFNRLSSEFRSSKQFGSQVRVQKNALSTKAETSLIQKAKKDSVFKRPVGKPRIRSIL